MNKGIWPWLNRFKYLFLCFYLALVFFLSLTTVGILLGWKITQPVVSALDRGVDHIVEKRRAGLNREYLKAENHASAGNPAEAERILESLVSKISFQSRISPEGALKIKALTRLGGLYQEQGKRRLARETYQELVDLNPGDPRSHVLYARSLLDAGEETKAELHLTQTLDANPHDTAAVTTLVKFYVEKQRMKHAIDVYQHYQDAFCMAKGINEDQKGFFLLDGDKQVSSNTFLPLVDGKKRVYKIPIQRKSQKIKDSSFDALEIRLSLPNVSHILDLEAIRLLAPLEVSTSDSAPLWEELDFTSVKTSGLETIEAKAGRFKVISQDVRLHIPLLKRLKKDTLSVAEIRILIEKNPLDEITEHLQKARQYLELHEAKVGIK